MDLLLTAALLLQDKTAEETFKKIEETIESARTVSITFKVEAIKSDGTKAEKSQVAMTWLLKEPNKVSLSMEGILDGREIAIGMMCDGEKVGMLDGHGNSEKAPPGFKASNATIFVRTGSLGAIRHLSLWGRDMGKEKETIRVSDFTVDSDDGDAKTIRYKLTVGKSVLDAKLWYEPRTYALRKRTFTGKADGMASTVTETYGEFTLNVDIPDESFNLQERK